MKKSIIIIAFAVVIFGVTIYIFLRNSSSENNIGTDSQDGKTNYEAEESVYYSDETNLYVMKLPKNWNVSTTQENFDDRDITSIIMETDAGIDVEIRLSKFRNENPQVDEYSGVGSDCYNIEDFEQVTTLWGDPLYRKVPAYEVDGMNEVLYSYADSYKAPSWCKDNNQWLSYDFKVGKYQDVKVVYAYDGNKLSNYTERSVFEAVDEVISTIDLK
jgi:hypothetical protein